MKKTVFISLLFALSLVCVGYTAYATGANKGQHYVLTETQIGQFEEDWEFYYKDHDGNIVFLENFNINQELEPIVYDEIVYVRAGFLVEYLGFGATLDLDNHKLTFYHPNFQSEGADSLPTRGEKEFKNCGQAFAEGFSNIPKDSPYYSSRLDPNGNGLACEINHNS